MHRQLAAITADLREAAGRLHDLAARTSAEEWSARPPGGGWSPAECVEHLNITARVYLPILEDALERARRAGGSAPERYRMDLFGWLLWKVMPPPVRMRAKTPPAFVPGALPPKERMVAEFDRLQQEQIRLVEAMDGLPLQKVRVASPFNERVKYNVFSCVSILAPHQHRHLWQAEQVLARAGAVHA